MQFPLLAGILGLQGPELIIIFILILVLFGAKKLPEFARGLGKASGEFRRAKDEFEHEIHRASEEVRVEEDHRKQQFADTQHAAATQNEEEIGGSKKA